jgi:List-Bact-rpt repeat protein
MNTTRNLLFVAMVVAAATISALPGEETTTASSDPTEFLLTVEKGNPSGKHAAGTRVTVSADAPKAGAQFAGWTGDVAILANPSLPTTSATIPFMAVTISATYTAPAANSLPALDAAGAGPFDNSLWLGTDNNTNTRPVLNTDRAGNELRRVDMTEANGIAIDLAANRIYFAVAAGQITGRDLNDPATTLVTLNPATSSGEDMAFDGTFLWRTDVFGEGGRVRQIDPSDGSIRFSFYPGFSPLGVAWDGSNLWVSEYNAFKGNELIKQFTPAGVATGRQFIAPLGGKAAGGLAFDTSDNTL